MKLPQRTHSQVEFIYMNLCRVLSTLGKGEFIFTNSPPKA